MVYNIPLFYQNDNLYYVDGLAFANFVNNTAITTLLIFIIVNK